MSNTKNVGPMLRHLRSTFELREALLEASLAFVRAVRRLPGVSRVALIGSLVTPKSKPHDCDLLVSVTDEVDMSALSKLGRKLKGQTGGMGSGADIFVCDGTHRYIGRTCEWRDCWPRVRCDALNCGLRPGLHDDLDTLRLEHDLTLHPPLELFPAVVARVVVPRDVEEVLMAPLSDEVAR